MRKTIQQLEAERVEIERQIQAELDRNSNMTLPERVADMLHERLCLSNHTDMCGWGYETNWSGDTHARYLKAANELIAFFGKFPIANSDVIPVLDKLLSIIRSV